MGSAAIPIQSPHIDPPIFQRMGGEEGLAPLIQALEFYRTANIQQQTANDLHAQRQADAAQQAQAAQDQADGTKAFYDHLSGTAARAAKPGADGQPAPTGLDPNGFMLPLPQIERGLSPGAHAVYTQLVGDHNKTVQAQLDAQKTQVATDHDRVATALAMAQQQAADRANQDATTTQAILGRWGPQLQTDAGQRGAIRDVLSQVGPDAAEKVANSLNVGTGRYGHVVVGDGLYIVDTKTGTTRRDVTADAAKTTLGQQRAQAIQRNAGTIVDLLDAQSQIAKGTGLEGTKNPVIAALLQDSHFMGMNVGALANAFRSDPEQLTQMMRTRFAHNYVGLLPASRSTAALLQNLTESYWAPAGSSAATLQRAEQDRQRLRNLMVSVRDGKVTDLSKIPGFSAAAAAAAMEGQAQPNPGGGAVQANPDDFVQPVKP